MIAFHIETVWQKITQRDENREPGFTGQTDHRASRCGIATAEFLRARPVQRNVRLAAQAPELHGKSLAMLIECRLA